MNLHCSVSAHDAPLREVLGAIWRESAPFLVWCEPVVRLARDAEGNPLCGRLSGFRPLAAELPEPGLALAEARAFLPDAVIHLVRADDGRCHEVRWSEMPAAGGTEFSDVDARDETLLLWRDRERFGLPDGHLPVDSVRVRSYRQAGRLLAWRILPGRLE